MPETQRFVAAAFCIIRDSKLLLVRSRNKRAFYLPGGKIEIGESHLDAVCRELSEELAISLDRSSLTLYGVFVAQAYGEPEGVFVELHCFMGSYEGTIRASGEIADVEFFTLDSYRAMPETAPAVVLLLRQLHADALIA